MFGVCDPGVCWVSLRIIGWIPPSNDTFPPIISWKLEMDSTKRNVSFTIGSFSIEP